MDTDVNKQHHHQPFQPMPVGLSEEHQPRQNLMKVNRPSLLEDTKLKCLNRLVDHRRSQIHRLRQEQMQILTESKMKSGYIEKQVHEHIYNDNVMHGLILQELNQLPEMTIDQWNEDYDQILNELNSYLAQELLQSTATNELYHYDKYQQQNIQETEEWVQTYDPNNNTFYICAICKRYVYKVKDTKICCERAGCIDIDLNVFSYFDPYQRGDFKLEQIMNLVMSLVLDHRQSCEQSGQKVCDEQSNLKLKIGAMNQMLNADTEDDCMEGECLAIFLTCDCCTYMDFATIY